MALRIAACDLGGPSLFAFLRPWCVSPFSLILMIAKVMGAF